MFASLIHKLHSKQMFHKKIDELSKTFPLNEKRKTKEEKTVRNSLEMCLTSQRNL